MTRKLLIINGPNLNLLGQREPDIYGKLTLADIEQNLANKAQELGAQCDFFQSNHEGELVERIHQAMGQVDWIIINALSGVNIPFIEVHISNVHQRESFRHVSYLSDKAVAVICGLGAFGYEAALLYAINH